MNDDVAESEIWISPLHHLIIIYPESFTDTVIQRLSFNS